MSQPKLDQPENGGWQWLYIIGGATALISVLIVPIQIVVYTTSPPPSTALDWFTLFQDSKLLGFLAFEGLFVLDGVLAIPTALALYVALRRTNQSLMAIALALGLVGNVALIVARPAFEMLILSDKYAAAPADAQRALFLAAGEAMIATFNGTAWQVAFNLGNIYLVLIPVVMLQSNIFGRTTAYMGLLAGVLGFGIYLPKIGLFLGILSALFLAIWEILIALRLFQLGWGGS
jgi:hypothetical protein